MKRKKAVVAVALLLSVQSASGRADAPREGTNPATSGGSGEALAGCLPTGNGFLRARIRGGLNLDISWKNAELECDGGMRPDGSGIRLSFAGPTRSDGRRLRMVFGVADVTEGQSGSALPTNLTVIFEGEQRMFATRGEDRCTVDKLQQERLGPLGGDTRSYRVIASGFCITPVPSLNTDERIVVNSFDFAGRVRFTTLPKVNPDQARVARRQDLPAHARTPLLNAP
ncbi:MAG: hypothetical protein IRZ28_12420 [Steroidobacteraceae bacterium]|nr:hypothetical protein [Steroidobacteraceae bacterium]